MKKLLNNRRLGIVLLVGIMILFWVTVTLAIGPPDEAPPFITPGP